MVYQGKPSAGCQNCRKRKIKCDEATPACSQCINTKRECPGYIARFDLILRDQTKSVRRKAQRKRQSTQGPQSTQKFPTPPVSASSEEVPATTTWTPVNLGEASSSAVVKTSSALEGNVPRMFNDFPEQQAVCAFFLDFVMLPRHPDSVQGHLEHLLPLYNKTSPESPLRLATSSVALAFSGNSPTRQNDHQLGRSLFGRALRKTSAAIRNPQESRKDETLMAVLLLALFEKITASAEVRRNKMAQTHNAGAAALIMHRGQANVISPVAVGLLFAVRSQLVEHAIEEAQSFKRCPDGISAVFKSAPQNAAARLTSATVNIADLRSCAQSALTRPQSPESDQEVSDLLEYAISVDLLVAAWPVSLPPDWTATAADGFDYPLNIPKSTFIYNDSKDLYIDLWVQSIWNQYRSARIKIQTIILDCIAYLGQAHEHHWYWRAIYAKMITQEMTDDLCASVPFALGTKTLGGPGDRTGIEYPYAGAQKVSEEHRRAASALGGWHLLEPMKTALRTTCLRDGQTEWIMDQVARIGRIYALQSQQGEASSPNEQDIYSKQMLDRYEFGCPS